MKRITLSALALVFVFTAFAYAVDYDAAPGIKPGMFVNAPTDTMWELQFNYAAETLSGDNGCVGVSWDGTYIWVSGRGVAPNPNMIYIISADGTQLVTSFPSGSASAWGVRDHSVDGTYIYGGWESGLIKYDPSPLPGSPATIVTTIPFPGGQQFGRANAFDPAGNNGQGSFYCGNFSNPMYEMDMSGNLLRTFGAGPVAYGMAWDAEDPAGPWLWVHSQTGGCVLHQYNPTTMTPTGVQVDITNALVAGAIAGGLEHVFGWDPQYSSFFALGQGTPDVIGGFEGYLQANPHAPGEPTNFNVTHNQAVLTASLSWTNPSVTVGGATLTDLDGARIYRDGNLIHTLTNVQIGQPSTYDDTTVPNPGFYAYMVKCYNDSGDGLPANGSAYIGLDTPGEPGNVTASPDTGGALVCEINWTAPTAGAHGGYWPAGSWTGQKIYRNGTEIADLTGTNTAYVDSPAVSNYYIYGVAYYNASGTGAVGNAPEVYVGSIPRGEYDVGGGLNHFPNVVSAAASINNTGVGGPVTFNVYPGTYTGMITLNNVPGTSATNVVTFRGVPGMQRPVVTNPADDGFYLEGVSYITIDNFEFTGCGGYGGVYTYYSGNDSANHIIISNNYFHTQAVNYNQYSYRSHHVTLCGNEVAGGSYGLRVRYCPNTEGYNNMIYGQTTCGFYTHNTTNSNYCYNSIYDESNYTLRIGTGSEANTIVNNIAYNYDVSASYGCVFYQSAPLLHDYNNFYAPNGAPIARYISTACATLAALQAASGQEAHSISVDPLFVSATDLHIGDNSPCVGAGTPVAGIDFDFDGDPRDANTPCIGADEIAGGLRVTLTPHNPPITIPAGGGQFVFDAEIHNAGDSATIFDGWTEVVLPNGAIFGPLVLRTNLPIAPGQTILRIVTQNVPGGAPAGNYTYVGNAGTHPGTVEDCDTFPFSKLAGDAPPAHNNGWAVYGWFGDETTLSSVPTEYRLGDAYPNPFNPTTRIDFALKSTGKVHLTVFDVTGREVATLVNGEMPAGHHNLTFNGEGLASGVYFYKLTTQGFSDTKKMVLVK